MACDNSACIVPTVLPLHHSHQIEWVIIALLILVIGVLALLVFSSLFRRFMLISVVVLVVAGSVAAGINYIEINRKAEQAMTEECRFHLWPERPWPPESCEKWLAEHPQVKAESERAKWRAHPGST
jgi:hypothetical protein